jgi:stress-induced-phosphoprotein 1
MTSILSVVPNKSRNRTQQRYQAPDEEQIKRAMANPEIQRIVQKILKDIRENPASASRYFADQEIREGLSKLRDAGILQFA